MEIGTTDYHTAGEPFRIVDAGAVEIAGETVSDRRDNAAAIGAGRSRPADVVSRAARARGHVRLLSVPPDDDGADLGVLFWHKDGYSTACGHGTIALGAWAVQSGRVGAPADGEATVTIDVPSGRVTATVRMSAGEVQSVAFRNVPAFVMARGVAVAGIEVDVAYGGAIYAFAPASSRGLRVAPEDLPELIAAGRAVKRELDGTDVARHPHDDRLSGVYGTVFYEQVGPLHQRTVAIFADGEVDRSPTGSATSARTALLLADGAIADGVMWRAESIVGTMFRARAIGRTADGLLTEVEGTAFRTGRHRFYLDPRDPLGTGFVLR